MTNENQPTRLSTDLANIPRKSLPHFAGPDEFEPEPTVDELSQRYWAHSGLSDIHMDHLDRVTPRAQASGRDAKWWRAFDAVLALLNRGGVNVLLGPRGVGKTQIGAGLVRHWCFDRHLPAAYRNTGAVFEEIRSTFHRGSSITENQIIQRLVRARLLILDEAHERSGSDFEQRTLTRIIDERYGSKYPTLFIANTTPDAFAQAVGPSIADRIQETGGVVDAKWESYRKSLVSIVQTIN